MVIQGVVREGKIIPESPLPEGASVHITLVDDRTEFTPEEKAEFAAWSLLGAQSLAKFEQMLDDEEAAEQKR